MELRVFQGMKYLNQEGVGEIEIQGSPGYLYKSNTECNRKSLAE